VPPSCVFALLSTQSSAAAAAAVDAEADGADEVANSDDEEREILSIAHRRSRRAVRVCRSQTFRDGGTVHHVVDVHLTLCCVGWCPLQTRGRAVVDEEFEQLQAKAMLESLAPEVHPLDAVPAATAALTVLKKAVRGARPYHQCAHARVVACVDLSAAFAHFGVAVSSFPCRSPFPQLRACEESFKTGMSERGSNWFTKANEAKRGELVLYPVLAPPLHLLPHSCLLSLLLLILLASPPCFFSFSLSWIASKHAATRRR
jgi:hypothetical protein